MNRPRQAPVISRRFDPTSVLVIAAIVLLAAGAWAIVAKPWQPDGNASPSASNPAPIAATAPASGAPCNACTLPIPDRFGQGKGPPGMVWIPGGEFLMGNSGGAPGVELEWEKPVHRVKVDGFYMDHCEVTNAQFEAFVNATGYVTTAEQAPKLEDIMKDLPPGTPPPPKEKLVPASLVFHKTLGPVRTDGDSWAQWWAWVPGANWRHPEGPNSDIKGKELLPVVQVSWFDAVAYCRWAGRRLPTEAEWEFAARGGLAAKPYTWGDKPYDPAHPQANIWQGEFPYKNTAEDGYEGIAPVMKYPPNGYGLYDMAGNVWEWCSDWFDPGTYQRDAAAGLVVNPQGPNRSVDPDGSPAQKKAIRGGSFLCSDSYCASYRPSARMHTTPDSASNHQGFRAVK